MEEFTYQEKKACLFLLIALADCDGRRNKEEIRMLTRSNTVLGVTTDEMLGGISFSATSMSLNEVNSIVSSMNSTKKSILEKCMEKIMEADGPANYTEINAWWAIQLSNNLPTWVSRKNGC